MNGLVYVMQNAESFLSDWNEILHFDTLHLWMVRKTVSFYGEE